MHQFTRVAQARAWSCTSGSRREEGDVASGNGAASGLGNENLQACVDPLEDTARTRTNVSAEVGINLFNLNLPDRRVH